MPTYTIKDPTSGKTVVLKGDSPPTAEELTQIFASIKTPTAAAPTADSAPVERPGAFSRFASGVAQTVLPSTTAGDYIEGPLYAARHPLESISLLLDAIKGSHTDQAHKTAESAGRVLSAPTLGGKVGAASEALGHGLATILPVVGPTAARAGEAIAEGDVAGGLGQTTGLMAPFGVKPALKAAAPVMAAASERLAAAATTQMEKGLNPTRIDTKAQAARIAPEMLKRRVSGGLPALEERAAMESAKAGQAVSAKVAAHGTTTRDVLPMVEELEKAKAPYQGKAASGATVVNDPSRVKAIQRIQDTLMEYGDQISVESFDKFRRNLDETVTGAKAWNTDTKGKIKAWAAREGRTVLRDELRKAVPDVDAVMAEYSFWQSLEDVAHATNERRVGQARNLTTTIAGAGGAVAADAVLPGSGIVMGAGKAALGAKAAASLKKLLESPGYQTWSAVQKQRLADALMSRNTRAIELSIGRGLRAVSQRPQPVPVPQTAREESQDVPVRSRAQ